MAAHGLSLLAPHRVFSSCGVRFSCPMDVESNPSTHWKADSQPLDFCWGSPSSELFYKREHDNREGI